ncbi:hypothetical protein M5585_01855 [Serratia ureilytica]
MHSALQLTEAARPVLRGEVALQLAVPRIQSLKSRGSATKILRRQLRSQAVRQAAKTAQIDRR